MIQRMTKPKDIRLIFYLPNLKSYTDRAHMVGQIAHQIEKAVLVLGKLDAKPVDYGLDSSLEIVTVSQRAKFPGSTMIAASNLVRTMLNNGNFNIVHDTFGHLLPLFIHRSKFKNCTFLTSLYTLSEWNVRNILWPHFGFTMLRYPHLRQVLKRIPSQRMILSRSDCCVVQAPELIDRLIQYIQLSREKVAWIPNNIAYNSSFPDRKMSTKSEIRLLHAGSFSVGKGADVLIDLLHLAITRNIPMHVTVTGFIELLDKPYLMNRIHSLKLQDYITILGHISKDRLYNLYDSSDWLFHVSSLDGSPRVVLEALSRGLPVIGSHHPGIKVLDPEQQFILFSNREDMDMILDELVISKKDPREYTNRSLLGQSYIKTNFSSEAVSKRYVNLYMRLINERLSTHSSQRINSLRTIDEN